MKLSKAFFSTGIPHRELPFTFLGMFGLPGEPSRFVEDRATGQPQHFRSAAEAELAGFQILAAKLNRARDVQEFLTKRSALQAKNASRAMTPAQSRPSGYADPNSFFRLPRTA